ncbi:MAG: class I SAM-dependent methyltransferase [Bacteroidota bacterium]
MKEFAFKPVDTEGEETLNAIALADHFNKWMYETIKPYCSGKILEIGSGVGNISAFFLNDQQSITLSDIREGYCNSLRGKFGSDSHLSGIEQMDLVEMEFDIKFGKYFGRFDTVFALNVVEHIFNDQLAVSNCYKLLKPGGNLVILVPAYQWLYNDFDKELEHYRRYTRQKLESLFVSAKFRPIHSQYYNAAGMAGWYVSGKMQHHKVIPSGQIRLFNRLVVLFKLFDALIFNSFGLSVITVGKK